MVTDANNMVMPVGPMYGNGGGGMFGGNNGDLGWILQVYAAFPDGWLVRKRRILR